MNTDRKLDLFSSYDKYNKRSRLRSFLYGHRSYNLYSFSHKSNSYIISDSIHTDTLSFDNVESFIRENSYDEKPYLVINDIVDLNHWPNKEENYTESFYSYMFKLSSLDALRIDNMPVIISVVYCN